MSGFRLIKAWDASRELAPEDFQYILRPAIAFEKARVYYDLEYENYNHFSLQQMPDRKCGFINSFSPKYQRKQSGLYDGAYDHTENNIDTGCFLGIDESEEWSYYNNPFYFDENGDLIYDCFMHHWHEWFEMQVREAYDKCLNNHQGRKPAPTQKIHYSDAPVQHVQAAKTINSKAAGRLLAAGGIYNGNIEDFKKTAEQLGGDAAKGYDQVLNEKTAGTAIAVASILLAKRSTDLESIQNITKYVGKVRGDSVLLNNVEVTQINYVKRTAEESTILRKEFNSTVRKSFLKNISNSSEAMNKFPPEVLQRMTIGRTPDGWQVHHNLPLDDSGSNAFDNLTLMKNDPYHQALTNYQLNMTRSMQPGESKIILWIKPEGSIYPK